MLTIRHFGCRAIDTGGGAAVEARPVHWLIV